ncbi:MAG TPA: B12-binding domain-containing radical SAM protein [Gemmatimonadaceae bacterium]
MTFKIVRVVGCLAVGEKVHRRSRYGTLTFPPLSLGVLSRRIRDSGFDCEQDDLHKRWYCRATMEADTERLRTLADDERRMWRYLEGKDDQDWEWFGRTVASLSDFEAPDVFLLSLISSDLPCCVSTLAFARYLKNRFRKPIIAGGEYFAYAPIYDEIERVLSNGVLDYYILGFGEEPLQRLLSVVSGRSGVDDLARVQGLCWLDHGRVRRNPMTLTHAVVPPDFTGLPIDLYRWSAECPPPDADLPPPVDELTLPFHLTTGCPHNCAFCECSGMKTVSVLPAARAVEELRKIIDLTGCRTFFFLDNTLNVSRRYVNALCDRLIDARLNIQWMDCSSAHDMDQHTLERMREAGAIRIVWGLESGSDRILEYVGKPVRLAQISNVLRMAHDVGLWNGVEVIIGMPTETADDFAQTMRFVASHAEVLDEVWTYPFYLNSNSAMSSNYLRYGIENVRRVNVGLSRDEPHRVVTTTHTFDEKNGLCWRDNMEQQKRWAGIMLEHVASLGLYPMSWEHEQQPNLLSWCYRNCATKAEVRRLYSRYWERLSLARNPRPAAAREWEEGPYDATSLLVDGRYHEWLVYNEMKRKTPHRASCCPLS